MKRYILLFLFFLNLMPVITERSFTFTAVQTVMAMDEDPGGDGDPDSDLDNGGDTGDGGGGSTYDDFWDWLENEILPNCPDGTNLTVTYNETTGEFTLNDGNGNEWNWTPPENGGGGDPDDGGDGGDSGGSGGEGSGGEEGQCPNCNEIAHSGPCYKDIVCNVCHKTMDMCQCNFGITNCTKCYQKIQECICCGNCGTYPCECFCNKCGEYRDRCTCNDRVACSICGSYESCTCCLKCQSQSCRCDDSDENDKEPEEGCKGEQCRVCNGYKSIETRTNSLNGGSTKAACSLCICKPPRKPKSPCDEAAALNNVMRNDLGIISEMNRLHQIFKAGNSLEYGFMRSDNPSLPIKHYTGFSREGHGNSIHMTLEPGLTYDWRVHTHPNGFSLPSAGDIFSLYGMMNMGVASDDFTYAIVGSTVMKIEIEDETAFRAFMGKDPRGKAINMDKELRLLMRDLGSTSNAILRNSVMDYYSKSGLRFIEGEFNTDGSMNWTPLELDSTGNIKKIDCNK